MPTKHITIPLQQLKQYESALQESVASVQGIIDDFELEEDCHTYKHMLTLKQLLVYIQNDIKVVEEYEEQLEAYRKQLEKEE